MLNRDIDHPPLETFQSIPPPSGSLNAILFVSLNHGGVSSGLLKCWVVPSTTVSKRPLSHRISSSHHKATHRLQISLSTLPPSLSLQGSLLRFIEIVLLSHAKLEGRFGYRGICFCSLRTCRQHGRSLSGHRGGCEWWWTSDQRDCSCTGSCKYGLASGFHDTTEHASQEDHLLFG